MSLKIVRSGIAVALLSGVTLFLPGQAAAQDKQTELSGGWSYTHESDVSMPAGWYASVNRYLNNWFGVTGVVNGHYKTISESGVDTKTNLHMFTAGPRFAYRKYPRFTPFVDLLAGARYASAVATGFGGNVDDSVTRFAYQSNLGFAINNRSGSLGVRVSVGDYGIHSDGEWTNDSSFEAGLVIRR